MKIALIFPRFKYPSGDPPLGMAILASCLREWTEAEVDLLDVTFVNHKMDYLQQALSRKAYDIVGISTLTSMAADAFRVAALAKSVRPGALVIVGGPHATILPEETLAHESVDAVIIGEGEDTLTELVRAGGDPTGIAGIWYKADGEIRRGAPRPGREDLDSIPFPAWGLLPFDEYMKSWFQLDAVSFGLTGTSIVTSRGCPYHCAYCQPTLETIFGRRLRRRSPENVVAELRTLKERFGIRAFMAQDDTFTVNPAWVRRFCEIMREADLGLLWGCNVRADTVTPELLADMKSAGLRIIHMGIESASQRILDEVYHKGITIEQVERSVRAAHEIGLCVRGYFMLGAPTETEAEIRQTIGLAPKLLLDDVTFSITTPLPHTTLYDQTRHLIGRDVEQFDYYRVPVYRSATVSPRRLDLLKKWGYLRFYLGPRLFFRTLRSLFEPYALRKTLYKLKRF